MRLSAQICVALTVLTLAGSAAQAASAVDQKIAAAATAASRERAGWKVTQASLKGLSKRVALRAALGQRDEHITLGERSGAHNESSVYYQKHLHFGLTTVSAMAPTKVEWKEQLVMGPRGLERLGYRRYAPVKAEHLRLAIADLDAQFARKPDSITAPQVTPEHEPFGAFQLVARQPVKTGFFSKGVKLAPEHWSHVTAEQIDSAVEAWGKK